jgi:hypothetical protein
LLRVEAMDLPDMPASGSPAPSFAALVRDRVHAVITLIQLDREGAAEQTVEQLRGLAALAQRQGAVAIQAMALAGFDAARRWAAGEGAAEARVALVRVAMAIHRGLERLDA